MKKDPKNMTLSEEQARLLANIFRIILPEIKCDEDKHRLAPGEMGISYKEGTLYARNPHTGELFSPNSTEYIKDIITKYDYKNNILNADRVANITFYSRLGELDKLTVSFTPDSVIRQMHGPAIFFGAIEYENYEALDWPSNSGLCLAYKSDEEHAYIRYYDNRAYTTYEGRYNHIKHMFEGWAIGGSGNDNIYTETIGGGDSTNILIDKEIFDLMVVTIRVTETINPGATISVNRQDPVPIVIKNGEPLPVEIAPNNIIMLIYDEHNNRWVLLESTESALIFTINVLSTRLDEYVDNTHLIIQNLKTYYDTALQNLRDSCARALEHAVETLTENFNNKLNDVANRPGNIYTSISTQTVTESGINKFDNIENFNGSVDKLVVNYGQTLLRPEVDYVVTGNGITLISEFTLEPGDVIQFIVIKQVSDKSVTGKE